MPIISFSIIHKVANLTSKNIMRNLSLCAHRDLVMQSPSINSFFYGPSKTNPFPQCQLCVGLVGSEKSDLALHNFSCSDGMGGVRSRSLSFQSSAGDPRQGTSSKPYFFHRMPLDNYEWTIFKFALASLPWELVKDGAQSFFFWTMERSFAFFGVLQELTCGIWRDKGTAQEQSKELRISQTHLRASGKGKKEEKITPKNLLDL